MNDQKDRIRIANISGFYGDRFSAAQEMIEGGPVDFLTGDYLAELTMAILYKSKIKNPEAGYAKTFLKQMESVMGPCMDRNIRVVVNAGGLNPSGLAQALEDLSSVLKIHPSIAYIEGDDLMPRLAELKQHGETFQHIDKNTTLQQNGMVPVSANAYFGCWGIVEALVKGADIIVTGRVADTSLVMGPAAYHFEWSKDDWDSLAGAAVAGHIIECGGQASGGNYAFFEEVESFENVGFPIAEIGCDGSSVITKHPNTGGLVSIGTVSAQLMYEIASPEYITPDVIAHFDTIRLEQIGEDRVSVSDVKGSPATITSKVTFNCIGGFQNTMNLHLVGLNIDKKVDILKKGFLENVGGEETFDKMDIQVFKTHSKNPSCNEEAFSLMRISVVDKDAQKAGKFFTSKFIELSLSTVPGWCISQPPGPARPRIVHFPALIDKKYLKQTVHVNNEVVHIDEMVYGREENNLHIIPPVYNYNFKGDLYRKMPLGLLYAARSGDKGGNANLGVWAKTPKSYVFLKIFLTVEKLKTILPDTENFAINRYDFPNLLGLNFVLHDFLQEGVAASTKMDGQAKTLGEYLRMKQIDIPLSLLV